MYSSLHDVFTREDMTDSAQLLHLSLNGCKGTGTCFPLVDAVSSIQSEAGVFVVKIANL